MSKNLLFFEICKDNSKNNKICSLKIILKNEIIGVWVTDKPTSTQSRFLFQEQMQKKWWETDDLGRYCNHSEKPNTSVIYSPGKLELKASRTIQKGEEILVNYKEITRYTGYVPETDF